MAEKPVDSGSVAADTAPKPTVEDLLKELEKANSRAQFEQSEKEKALEESKKFRDEAKKAFDGRDEAKKIKSMEKEDILASYEKVRTELSEKDKEISNLRQSIEQEKKLELLKQIALKAGLKEKYVGVIDRFVDVSEVKIDKPISAEIQIDVWAKNMPDLFGRAASAQTMKDAWGVPKLVSGNMLSDLEEEYRKELAKPGGKFNADVAQELRAKIEELKGK